MDSDMRAWRRDHWGLYLRPRALLSMVIALPLLLALAAVLWTVHGAKSCW